MTCLVLAARISRLGCAGVLKQIARGNVRRTLQSVSIDMFNHPLFNADAGHRKGRVSCHQIFVLFLLQPLTETAAGGPGRGGSGQFFQSIFERKNCLDWRYLRSGADVRRHCSSFKRCTLEETSPSSRIPESVTVCDRCSISDGLQRHHDGE